LILNTADPPGTSIDVMAWLVSATMTRIAVVFDKFST